MSALNWDRAKKGAASSLARSADAIEHRMKQRGAILGGPCSKCTGQTVQRLRKRDSKPFFGCRSYPKCTGTWSPVVV